MNLPVIRGTDEFADCPSCPYNGQTKVYAEGRLDAKFIAVAEGPGGKEIQSGRPLIGPTGEMLQKAFTLNKTKRADVWLTNSTLCLEFGTQVRLADGSLRSIGNIVASRYAGDVMSLDQAGQLVSRRVTNWYKNPRGSREMRRLTFEHAKINPRGIVGAITTEDHPILTPEGWIPTRDVAGGLIATGGRMASGNALAIVYGSMFGDGTVNRSRFGFTHAVDQIEYAYLKMSALSNLDLHPHYDISRTFGWQDKVSVVAAASVWGRQLREMFYNSDGSRRIPRQVVNEQSSDLLFAIWYLDDGFRYPAGGCEIVADSYSRDELQYVVNVLRARGVDCYVNAAGPARIKFSLDGAHSFGRRIAKFVPPSMAHKLLPNYRGQFDPATYAACPAVTAWSKAAVLSVERRRLGDMTAVYCIDVEDTHNFLTPGGVVHNCSVRNASDSDKAKAAACCAPRLEHELNQLPVTIPVLALGAVASAQLVTSEFKISQIAGTYHKRPDGREVIPTIHPAAILRAGTGDANHGADLGFWSLIYDVQKVVALARGDDIHFKYDVLTALNDPALAEHLVLSICAAARELGSIAVDTETYSDDALHSALELPRAILKAIGLATIHGAVSFPWVTCTDATADALRDILADPNVTKVFHNAAYDRPVLTHHGMPVLGPIHDTMLMHHNAFPGLAHGLQSVTSQFYAVAPWKSEFRAGDESPQEMLEYNAKDTLTTARLVSPLQICIKRSDAEKTYEVDQNMLRVATDMHMNGIPFDVEVNRELNQQFTKVIAQSRKAIEADATSDVMFDRVLDELAFEQAKKRRKKDSPDIEERHAQRLAELRKDCTRVGKKKYKWSISKGLHCIAYLKARGVRFSKYTDTGQTQLNKDVLESISHIPEAKDIVDYREAAKMLSTYVRVMPFYVCDDNRIRPSWGVNKITGRWSCGDPNFMSVPGADPKKGRPNLRKQVVAPKGRRLVSFDYKVLEGRIIALLSDDDFMIGVFSRGEDLHDAFSRELWGPKFDQVDQKIRKVLRNATKRFEFGAFYGGAIDTLWKTLKKDDPRYTRADVAKALGILINATQGVQLWHEELIRKVAEPPFEIRSHIYGRRRVYPLGNAPPTETYNFGVQSTGADLMAKGLLDFVGRLKSTDMIILQVHDCLVVETDEDDVDRIKQAMRDSFIQELHTVSGRSVVFDIDVNDGENWAEV